MQAGALIDYQLSLYKVPIKWRTEIGIYEPNVRFTDTQLRGPYKYWHHLHEFKGCRRGDRNGGCGGLRNPARRSGYIRSNHLRKTKPRNNLQLSTRHDCRVLFVMTTSLVWFRGKDLRLSDHAPLSSSLSTGPVITVFVVDPYFFEPSRAQNLRHRMQFLLESLEELRHGISRLGGHLICIRGRSVEVIPRLARQFAVDRVVGYRWSEPCGARTRCESSQFATDSLRTF